VRRILVLLSLLVSAGACDLDDQGGDTATIERGPLVVEVDVSGTLRAVDSDSVGPPAVPGVWDYKIAMLAEEGAEVKEGEPVLAFDTSDLNRRLEQKVAQRDQASEQLELTTAAAKVAKQDAELEIAQAEGELRKAKLKADAPPDIVASIELEKLRLDVELAEHKVAFARKKAKSTKASHAAQISRWKSERDRAEQRVQQLTDAIERMTITSPRSGTVIFETNWRGEKKKVGDTAWRGETVLQVVSLAEMEARGEVDEVDFSKLSEQQPVSLRLDAMPDEDLRGTVREIGRTVRRQSPDNPLKIVQLEISLQPDEGLRLRPGMRFRGRVETHRIEDALVAPIDALVSTPEGPVALRRAGGSLERVPLTLGRRNTELVEILDGLEEGDEIVRPEAAAGPSPDPDVAQEVGE
jgi:hypothetical protein